MLLLLGGACTQLADHVVAANERGIASSADGESDFSIQPIPAGGHEFYLARQTEETQCGSVKPNLSAAVEDLRGNNPQLQVLNAGYGSIKETFYCAACGCPAGSYYITKVRSDDPNFEYVGWNVVDPASIVAKAGKESGL